MQFGSGPLRAVGFSSRLIVCPGIKTNCRANIGDAVLAAIRHNHEKLAWHCRLCLLMPDHLHAILAFPREPRMATTIKNWKKYVSGKYRLNIGNAISSIIVCATITKGMRRRATF